MIRAFTVNLTIGIDKNFYRAWGVILGMKVGFFEEKNRKRR